MPTLIIQTNVEMPVHRRKQILEEASSTVAGMLGKPESYIMVILNPNPDMLFAGKDTPLAFLELKSLGLPEDQTSEFSGTLCRFMETHFGIPQERIYIEFTSPPRHMFGWNCRTF